MDIQEIVPIFFGGLHFTIGVFVYMYIDISLQKFAIMNQKKDLKLMKTVHDLKNPVYSIGTIVNDKTLQIKEIRDTTNNEIEDLQEMLDNLRMEFKSSMGMSTAEVEREVKTVELLTCLKRSQKLLAKNGKNSLVIESHENFPDKILVQQLNLKRMINNLISNALKHTNGGKVTVYAGLIEADELNARNIEDCVHVGSAINYNQLYIMFEIKDNGKGIPQDKLRKIFDEKETDESAENWDGTGLGLPICLNICKNMNSFIRYMSVPGKFTVFRLFVP